MTADNAAPRLVLTPADREILRGLAARVAEIAATPIMAETLRLAHKINRLEGERPLLLLLPSNGLMEEALPPQSLQCTEDWARHYEQILRAKLYSHEVIGDDTILLPRFEHRGYFATGNYGVQSVRHWGNDGQGRGSMVWEPPLKNLPGDFEKLHFRTHAFDGDKFWQEHELLKKAFHDILPVVYSGIWFNWTMGLTIDAVDLMGLERFLYAPYDEPENVHRLMAFLRDDCMRMLDWMEASGLIRANNGEGIVAAGGFFHTDLLPAPDYAAGSPGRIKDLWALSESQETVGVSPEMFEEFIFPYQLPIISRFGLSCYGCCEPLDTRWHVIRKIPNLRRVSVSPWADQEKMAGYLGKNYIFSRKPNPTLISSAWNEELIRQDLRRTLELTRGLSVEFIMKDVMTVQGEPWRYRRWCEIAREEIAR